MFKEGGSGHKSILITTHGGWLFTGYRQMNKTGVIDGLMNEYEMLRSFEINTGVTQIKLNINRESGGLLSGACILNHSVAHLG